MNDSFNQKQNSQNIYQHFSAWYRTKGWLLLKSFYPIGLLVAVIMILFCGDGFRNFISVSLIDENALTKFSTDADFLAQVETAYENAEFKTLISYFLVENWKTYLPVLFGGLGISTILFLFVGSALSVGNATLYLGLVDGDKYSVKTALKTLLSCFLSPKTICKSLLLRLMKLGLELACFVPAVGVLVLMVLLVRNPVLLASTYLLMMALFVAGMIFACVVELTYYFTAQVLVDNPNLSALQIMKTTRKMMKGNKFRLFNLFFSMILYFIASYLLNMTLLGIYLPFGEILLHPILSTFTTVFYHDISDRKKWYKDAIQAEFHAYN